MFRPLRRTKNAISEDIAKDLLQSQKRAVLAVNGDDGYPFAFPVNYIYDRENNKIYVHGAKVGHKVDSLNKSDKVCFTVFGNDEFIEGDWAPYVYSTIVYGRCRLVNTRDITESKVRELARRYYPSEDEINEIIAEELNAVQLFEITIENICGKRIQEK